MDAAAAQALSLRLLPRLLRHAQRNGWAAPRPVSPQELAQFQLAVALLIITAPIGSGAAPVPARLDSVPRPEPGIFATLRSLDRQMDIYESQELQNLAREEIPIERLNAEATALQQSDSPLPCQEDALAQVLVQWFKNEYFKWADPIKCPKCDGKTQIAGMVPPTEYERGGGAGRVELHVCEAENGPCDGSFRFPRYNDPKYLMKTRLGRCGEWANLYTLFLRAVGLRARYVWNAEDHVWNMYFSPAAGRWLHTDSCEAARDQPLLYDKGWGKKMSYVVAFSVDGAMDVSRGHVEDWTEMFKRRNQAPEEALTQELAAITSTRRRNLPETKQSQLETEDETERTWLARGREEEQAEQSRISGTQEWKEARGEAGASSSSDSF